MAISKGNLGYFRDVHSHNNRSYTTYFKPQKGVKSTAFVLHTEYKHFTEKHIATNYNPLTQC